MLRLQPLCSSQWKICDSHFFTDMLIEYSEFLRICCCCFLFRMAFNYYVKFFLWANHDWIHVSNRRMPHLITHIPHTPLIKFLSTLHFISVALFSFYPVVITAQKDHLEYASFLYIYWKLHFIEIIVSINM